MAWTRAGQVTGESNSIEEFDVDLSAGNVVPTISSAQAMTGTYSVRHGVNSVRFNPTGLTFSAADCVRVSFWFRHNDADANDPCVVRLRSTSTLAEVRLNTSGNVTFYIAGTSIETKTAAQCGLDSVNTWQHISITYHAHASTGYVTFYVDGVAVFSYTGAVVGSPTGAYVGGQGGPSSYWEDYAYYDDLYVDTSASAEADACPFALRFVPKLLNGTTSNDTWSVVGAATAHAALATNDGDTSYLGSIASDDLFIGTLTDATIPAEHVASRVHTLDYAKRGDALSTVVTSLIDGSANTDESAEMTPGTSYTRQWATFDTAPDGGSWDNTKVNDISLGVKSDGVFA